MSKGKKGGSVDAKSLRASTPPPAMHAASTVTVKRETLEGTPARLLTFLRALA